MAKKDENPEEQLEKAWASTREEINSLDADFDEEDVMDKLRQHLASGEVDVKVMQIGPDGKLTDVSHKVNPKSLRPGQISGIQSDGKTFPIGRNPQSREAALGLLQELLGFSGTANSVSMQKMEQTLAKSDEILDHWKK